jgi:sugar O-acyltransferase (sialic acid O-acetyltransferase NeuD family)
MAAEPRKPLLLLGARSFAREAADLVSDIPEWDLRGFVENLDPQRCREMLEGLPVFWVDELGAMAETHWGICALGSTRRIGFIQQAERTGLRFATLIHPSARVSPKSTCGEGSIVCPGVQVASGTRIGRHALINRGALVGHNVELGDCLTIGPGANLAGFTRIGSGSYIGMGAIVVDRISIGSGSLVAAGAVVTRDVPDHVMVAGMPAVIVQRGVDGL